MIYAQGPFVTWADMWQAGDDELLTSAARVFHAVRQRNAPVTYDSIGVGAGVGAMHAELNRQHKSQVRYEKFNAGATVFNPDALYKPQTKNKDQFANLKAQAWWLVADRLRNTYNAIHKGEQFDQDDLLFIDPTLPHLDRLIDELTMPLREFDGNGRVKVESKRDLAKRNIVSPKPCRRLHHGVCAVQIDDDC